MKSLATLYRPKTFSEISGQHTIVEILKKQIEKNQLRHCYLFCGASGIGKTTTARALAMYINDGVGNPIEIDAASNSGVDNVRTIIEEANTRALDSKYKIFIIDECHSLSNQAWQAFLKTLEEPPEFTIFMFCTTNPEKVPTTIQNRCQKYILNKLSSEDIKKRLLYICEQEGFKNYEETCEYISKTSDGGMRDAIVALEKVADLSETFDIKKTLEVLGSYSYKEFVSLTNSIIDNREDIVLKFLSDLEYSGRSLKMFVNQYLSFILDLIKYSMFKDITVTSIPNSFEEEIKFCVGFEGNVKAFNIIVFNLLKLKNIIRYDDNASTTVKAYMILILDEVNKLWQN